MNELDKWAADQCGVILSAGGLIDGMENIMQQGSVDLFTPWTLSDARCRDVFVDKYKISIIYNQNLKQWVAEESKRYNFTYAPKKREGYLRVDDNKEQVYEGGEYAYGKSIEEAFLLCAKQMKAANYD